MPHSNGTEPLTGGMGGSWGSYPYDDEVRVRQLRKGSRPWTGRDAKRFNGKVERFFRTLKGWRRWTLLPRTRAGIQRKLDVFRGWYNTERPMLVLDGRTPEEMWAGAKPPRAIPIRAQENQPVVSVTRNHYGGDPILIKLDIRVHRTVRLIA